MTGSMWALRWSRINSAASSVIVMALAFGFVPCAFLYVFGNNILSNWCTGKTYPSIPQALKLAALLDVKVDDLYKLKEEELR